MTSFNIFKDLMISKESDYIHLRKVVFVVVCIWTLVILFSLFWNISNEYKDMRTLAENTARGAFKKDQSFRFWSTSHGGVYVPRDKRTISNPNLAHIADRDIQKPDGTNLTLMNPAYMIRQMMEEYPGLYGAKSRITSLKYFHEGNKPDEWEKKALKSFEKGNKESYEYTQKDSKKYLRLMRPMMIKKGCLKCHRIQGYKLGDVRGGVGVSVPMLPFNKIANKNIFAIILWHVGFWIIVILGVLFFAFREMIYIQRKMDTKNKLKENQIYLKNLFESTPNIMITTNGDEIDIANTAALDFFEFNSVEEFKNKHQCICDFFIDGDGLLSSEMDGVVWLKYILTNQDELHKVKMRNSVKIHTFLVWAKPLFIDKNSRSVVTFTDVTELEDAYIALDEKEDIMIAQSRHAAMGEMISMIAHQWRQPISVIAMGANNILADIELDSVDEVMLRKGAKKIVDQTQELSKIIDDFRGFFRPEKEIVSVLIEDIFRDVFKIVDKSLENNNIEVLKEFHSTKEIKTYSRELMQVFINIIKNSKEAIVESNVKEGKISIFIDETKENMLIKICDTGGGIKEEIMNKIFNPYFSTKNSNVGTGIGLYMSKTIIEKHLHGILRAYNFGDGVCFEISLPLNIKDSGELDG